MSKTAEQIQAMKNEIQAWLEKNDLSQHTAWHEVDEHYEGKASSFDYPHYLVLGYDGVFCDMMRGFDWQGRTGHWLELRAIIDKHGCQTADDEYLIIFDENPRI